MCCIVSTPHMPGWQALLHLSSLDMATPGSASTLQTCLLTSLAEDCWSFRLQLCCWLGPCSHELGTQLWNLAG